MSTRPPVPISLSLAFVSFCGACQPDPCRLLVRQNPPWLSRDVGMPRPPHEGPVKLHRQPIGTMDFTWFYFESAQYTVKLEFEFPNTIKMSSVVNSCIIN